MGGYARYIATREGAERIDDSHRHAPATQKQQALIDADGDGEYDGKYAED